MSRKKINIGVIGSGGMGGRHARNLATQVAAAQVVAIMDIDLDRAQKVAAECGATDVYDDAHKLINNPDVEAVVIASPNATHAECVLACLNANKPVLCEKPLADTTDEAGQIVQAEIKQGRRLLQMALMREFDQAHCAAKAALDRGEIGRPLLFRGVHINPAFRGVRQLGDVIVNSGVHDIHSTRWMMGSEIDTVFAQYVRADSAKSEGCRLVSIQLKLRSGALAVIEVNADSGYGYEVDVEITGTTGSIRTDSIQSPIVRSSNTRRQHIDSHWLTRFDSAYIIQVQAWVASLMVGKETGPSAWDGYMAQLIADACVESARSGQPVDIPAIVCPDLYRLS